MIIIDLNQIVFASAAVQINQDKNLQVDENLIRHIILNSLRYNKQKFKDYGEMVIANDAHTSWRKSIFPYYKANRKKIRDKSTINWTELFVITDKIKQEIKEFFPYKILTIPDAEADDIIGTLCNNFNQEKILIVSGDHDFQQLLSINNVEQYDPIRKKYIKNSNPQEYLIEQIFGGDTGDGIPNMLSPDNCLVIGERQKSLRKTAITEYKLSGIPDEYLRGYLRNKKLIDLTQTPDSIKDQIKDEFVNYQVNDRSQLFNYFIGKKLKNLMDDIQDF